MTPHTRLVLTFVALAPTTPALAAHRVPASSGYASELQRPGQRPISDRARARRGQLVQAELRFFADLAATRARPIVLTGSLSETTIGLLNRRDTPHRLPRWRRKQAGSSLLASPGGVPLDVDVWEGTRLTDDERARIAAFFEELHGVRPEIDDRGYSLAKYPSLASFAPRTFARREHADDDGGALVFRPSGRIVRVYATWQHRRFELDPLRHSAASRSQLPLF